MDQDFIPINKNSTIFFLIADDILISFIVLACIIPTFIIPCIKICKASTYPRLREDSIFSIDDNSDTISQTENHTENHTENQNENNELNEEDLPSYSQIN